MGFWKKKVEIRRIEKQSSRMVTFSKRKKWLFKKADDLQSKTGASIAIMLFSPAGKPYCHGNVALFDAALKTLLGDSCSSTKYHGTASTCVAVLRSNDSVLVGSDGGSTQCLISEEGLVDPHCGRDKGLVDGICSFECVR